jgi:nucleoside-diphosphate-sugar epimerase
MKIAVIGGSGHIGSYLVPRLVRDGHTVVCVARGESTPYIADTAWNDVETVALDRERAESDGTFGPTIASIGADAVIDLICFTPESARELVAALRGRVAHLIHCGTIWVHGHSTETPTSENAPRAPFGDYGIKKAAIERYLLDEARRTSLPVTIVHPGHIVGEGWWPLNPQGNFNPEVFRTIKRGEELAIPNIGMETVHHVHADDVARACVLALHNWSSAVGESFHVVSERALTLRGYAEAIYREFGHAPAIAYTPWETLSGRLTENDAWYTWDHIGHSPCCSIEKARSAIGYVPRYDSLGAVRESLANRIAAGEL